MCATAARPSGWENGSRATTPTGDNARQLVTRARRHVDAERPRFDVDRQTHEELTDRFLEATQNGDTEGLIAPVDGPRLTRAARVEHLA